MLSTAMELTIHLKDDSKIDLLLDALRRFSVEHNAEIVVCKIVREVLFDSTKGGKGQAEA